MVIDYIKLDGYKLHKSACYYITWSYKVIDNMKLHGYRLYGTPMFYVFYEAIQL